VNTFNVTGQDKERQKQKRITFWAKQSWYFPSALQAHTQKKKEAKSKSTFFWYRYFERFRRSWH
jgi:hypothetical protein